MKRAWLVLAAGCQANVGTLDVTLTTAPGSHVLDAVDTLRLVITNPHQVATATRQNGSFAIEIDLEATGVTGTLIVDGMDATGTVIATGATPAFPVGALDAHIAVYMAAPNSIALAPLALDPARSQLAIAPLAYGAVMAGGLASDATPSDAIAIYNAFDHTMTSGVAMPAPRTDLEIASGAGQYVYLYGGSDATGPTASFWRFDTSVAPAGSFTDLGAKPGFERTDQAAVPLGNEQMLVTGGPPIELSGLDGSINARTDAPSATLPPAGAAVLGNDGVAAAIFAGPTGVIRFRNNAFDKLAVPAPTTTDAFAVTALPGGNVLVLYDDASYIVDVADGTFTPTGLFVPVGGAVASTLRHVVVVDGAAASASIYDAATLALVTTQPLAGPRIAPSLVALPNGQILIAGGATADMTPVGALELFTPESTE